MKSKDIAIVGILLAIGAILRYFLAMLHTPLTPNMIIAFYCLAIILIQPKVYEALGIGIVAGALSMMISSSMFPPANLISEPIGALVCFGLYAIALKIKGTKSGIEKFKPHLAGISVFVITIIVLYLLTIQIQNIYKLDISQVFGILLALEILAGCLIGYFTYATVKKGSIVAPAFVTFLTTLASGFSFAAIAIIAVGATVLSKYNGNLWNFVIVFVPIVVITAVFNAVVVQILYIPSSRVLVRGQE
ncbi:MAG: tryptophan transporter [Methanoregula sp.]|jgi:low affinity Fe/Cu permease